MASVQSTFCSPPEENQKACSLVFPYAKDWLQNCMKAEIVRPICSFIGLSAANNCKYLLTHMLWENVYSVK